MTLDIPKYLENLIKKEAKVSHFTVSVRAGKTSQLKMNTVNSLKAQFGESFLLDANYILFFSRSDGWQKADMKSLFELVNRALGKDANNMTLSDFKVIEPSAAAAATDAEDSGEDENTTDAIATSAFMKITVK